MTTAKFETATLAEVIKRANQIAPTSSGESFDKAAGIMIEVDPDATFPVVVRSTNLDVYLMQWVDTTEVTGTKALWRVPSKMCAAIVGALPIGTGREVTLSDEIGDSRNTLHLSAGSARARFGMLRAQDYPTWGPFDPTLLTGSSDLGGRLSQVEWAADKSGAPLNGVNFDGNYALTTDRYRMCRVPMEVPLFADGVTVPIGILSTVLKQTGEVKVGLDDTQMYIMPDDYTQIRAIVYGAKFPDMGRALSQVFTDEIKIRKPVMEQLLKQVVAAVAPSNRDPLIKLYIGKGEMIAVLTNGEPGGLSDRIDLDGQAMHDRVQVNFSPDKIMVAIDRAPSEEIILKYNSANSKTMLYIDGGSGYEAWVASRQEMKMESEPNAS